MSGYYQEVEYIHACPAKASRTWNERAVMSVLGFPSVSETNYKYFTEDIITIKYAFETKK